MDILSNDIKSLLNQKSLPHVRPPTLIRHRITQEYNISLSKVVFHSLAVNYLAIHLCVLYICLPCQHPTYAIWEKHPFKPSHEFFGVGPFKSQLLFVHFLFGPLRPKSNLFLLPWELMSISNSIFLPLWHIKIT